MRPSLISIVIPCHNEDAHIGGMLRRTERVFADVPHECIVVMDGCTDASESVVREAMRSMPAVRLIANPKRLGKGGAIRRGIFDARGEVIGFIDGDGEIDPRFLRSAFDRLHAHRADIVIGNRCGTGGTYHTTLTRHFTSRAYRTVVWILFGLGLHDTQAGLKIFTAEAASRLFKASNVDGYAIDIDILIHAHWMGYRIEEMPIHQEFKGTSNVTFTHTLLMIADTCRTYNHHVRELFARRGRGTSPRFIACAQSLVFFPFTSATESILRLVQAKK